MDKILNCQQGDTGSIILSAGYSYSLGKFQLYLNEKTGELKVIVHTNKEHLQIKPSSGNSVILIACH